MSRKNQLLFLIVVTTVLYLPSLFADFVFDDHYLLEKNPLMRTTGGLFTAFTEDYYGQANPSLALGYYRPISLVAHWLDWQLFGSFAAGHHFANLLLHLGVIVLLYFFVNIYFEEKNLAFFAALLFAVHPSHVHSVTFISGKVDCLATFFALLALIAFVKRRALSGPLYAAALLSKEISVTVPVIAFWREKEFGWRKAFLSMIPFVAAVLAVIFVRRFAIGMQNLPAPAVSMDFVLVFFNYIRLMVFPPLKLYLEPEANSLPLALIVAAAIVYGCALFFLKNRRVAKFSAIWLLTLLPVIGLLQLETIQDERFLYFPSIGFSLLGAGWIVEYLHRRNFEFGSRKMVLAGIIIAGIYSPVLLVRQAYWQNDLALWSSALETTPDSGKLRLRYGIALLVADQPEDAEKELIRAIQLPDKNNNVNAAMFAHLGVVKQMQNKSEDVESLYRKALELNPAYYTAHFNLGLFYEKMKRYPEALQEYRAALASNPRSIESEEAIQRVAGIIDQRL